MFPFPLTRQQTQQRCQCGRYLAWPSTPTGHAPPRCYACMQPAEQCACPPTDQPAEGCLGLDLLADPADCE
jgi:hypothetical protein